MKLDFLSKQLLIFAAHSLLQTDAATAAAVTTVDRPIITPALHLLLLLLILTLLMILLGMMIVANAANRAAGEKLLQLTATGFRLTCSAAACATDASAAVLHFQLLAQLRVVVQIEVQVATDRGNGDGVRDGRGDCISQTSSYFGHRSRRRGRFGGRLLLLLLFLQQRRSTVGTGAGVSRARWTVGEMIDQQRRGRRRVVVVVVFAKIRRRLLQQQLGCDWCGSRAGRRSWRRQLLVVVQGGRRRKRTRRG